MKKIVLYIMVLAGICTSCKDFLTEEPPLSQSNEITLAHYSTLNDAVAGAYTYFQSYHWYGAQFFLTSELRGGNAKNPLNQSGSGRYRTAPFWAFNASNSPSVMWDYMYASIAAVNNVINSLDEAESHEVKEADINNLMGEALFIRALVYFDLVITYAQPYTYAPESLGVPVVLVTENGKPERDTVKDVYERIVADLVLAESKMSDDYARSNTEDWAAAATKPAVQALLSRVYLYMGEYQKCADYATKVINSGKFSLADEEEYLSMWTEDAANKGGEVIFEMYSSIKNNYWDGSGWEQMAYVLDPTGSADVCATRDLMDLFEDGDTRRKLYEEVDGEYFTLKYAGKEGSSVPKENNTVILRLSEMYLNRAEAIYHGASISGVSAESDLKAITDIRSASAVSPSATTIFNERRKELAFEGHITYDYARTNTSLVRSDYDGVETYRNITFPNNLWALPIPEREMGANENMVQNPGY